MIADNVRLGYCCINLSLADQKISANRGMIKRTFQDRGPDYCGELALLNLTDLLKILNWNKEHGIEVYRMSSDIFPWMSEYEITELKNFSDIQHVLSTSILAARTVISQQQPSVFVKTLSC